MLKPFLAIFEALGLQVSNAKNIGGFEILLQRDRSLQIADGCGKICAVKLDAPKHVLRARVTRVGGDDGPRELQGFLHVSSSEPSDCGISHNVRIIRGELERFVKFARGFIKARCGNGKVSELAKTESDGLLVIAFGFGEVSSTECGFGGFEIVLEESAGIIGGMNCHRKKRGKNKKEDGFRTLPHGKAARE